MRRASALMLLVGLLVAPLSAQVCSPTVGVPTNDSTIGTCNVIPFGQSATYSAGYSYLSRIPAASLDLVNTYFEDVAFSPCGTGNWSCGTVIMGFGHVPNPLPNPFSFPTFDAAGVMTSPGSFNDFTVAHNSFPGGTVAPVGTTTTGPLSWNFTTDTWSPIGFSTTGGTGFFWNGVDDVAFYVTYQSSTVTGHSGSFHRSTETRMYGSGYNIPASVSSGTAALNIQLTVALAPFTPGAPDWQCNQPSSSVDVNGAADPGPQGPMVTQSPLNTAVTVNLNGLSGMPWDLAYTIPEPGVPTSGGGLLLPDNQAINVDLTAPSLGFLFNLGFANSFAPFSIPANSAAPINFSFQQVVIDPSFATGVALSHLNELEFVACNGSENYDALSTGLGSASVGWSNPGAAGTRAWTVHTNGTSSSATGPTSAFNGANYAYCETSGYTNTVFTFDSCPTDVTTLSTGTLSFELSAIGLTIGTLNIYEGDGNGNYAPTPVFTQTGALTAQSQGGVEWTNFSVPVSFANPFVNYRFEYTSSTSFTGDLAIDDIQLN